MIQRVSHDWRLTSCSRFSQNPSADDERIFWFLKDEMFRGGHWIVNIFGLFSLSSWQKSLTEWRQSEVWAVLKLLTWKLWGFTSRNSRVKRRFYSEDLPESAVLYCISQCRRTGYKCKNDKAVAFDDAWAQAKCWCLIMFPCCVCAQLQKNKISHGMCCSGFWKHWNTSCYVVNYTFIAFLN